MNAERRCLGMPSSPEKILTNVPPRGATATVLPSGLMATNGQIDGDAAGDPADRRWSEAGSCQRRTLIPRAGQPVKLTDRRIETIRVP